MSRDLESLIDIVDSINIIRQYTANTSKDELATDLKTQDAVLRRITIIGEATKRLSTEFRSQHSSIPWKEIAGMRDVITHDYDEVNINEVWDVVCHDLPKFLEDIQPLM